MEPKCIFISSYICLNTIHMHSKHQLPEQQRHQISTTDKLASTEFLEINIFLEE